jgi:hypothetical protein
MSQMPAQAIQRVTASVYDNPDDAFPHIAGTTPPSDVIDDAGNNSFLDRVAAYAPIDRSQSPVPSGHVVPDEQPGVAVATHAKDVSPHEAGCPVPAGDHVANETEHAPHREGQREEMAAIPQNGLRNQQQIDEASAATTNLPAYVPVVIGTSQASISCRNPSACGSPLFLSPLANLCA